MCACACVRACVCAFDGNDYRLDLTFSEFLVCSLLSSVGSGLRRALVVVTQVCARIGRRCNATATFSSALYQRRKALQHSPQPYTKVVRRCDTYTAVRLLAVYSCTQQVRMLAGRYVCFAVCSQLYTTSSACTSSLSLFANLQSISFVGPPGAS